MAQETGRSGRSEQSHRERPLSRPAISRRQLVTGAVSLAGAGALAGCAGKTRPAGSQVDTANPSYKAGTYEASAQGRNAAIKVAVTFDDHAITKIEAEHEETMNIGDKAIEILRRHYLDSQSLNFDIVTGASLTSMAFANAVADCVDQAGGDVLALERTATGVEPAPNIEETCDVCVVGSGGAAFAAAVTALEAGKSVVMLEKMDVYGGNTNAGEGTLNAPDPERQQPMGIEDSPDFYYEQTFTGGDSTGDPALVRILADNALDAVHWMEAHGLVYEKEVFTAIGGLWQRGHAVETKRKGEVGGAYYITVLKKSADKHDGFKLYTDAKVTELEQKDGRVTGVIGTRPSSGADVHVRAGAVVIATGGYARNTALAMQYDKRVTEEMPSSNVSSSTGDGLKLGTDAGAGLRNMDLVQIHPLGDPKNGGVATFVGNWLGVENYVMVNDEGKRFIREDERRDTISDAILEQTNKEMWLLVDSKNIASDRKDQIKELVSTGHSFEDKSISGLAEQIGVPADALEQTIEGYNACVDAGVDTQIAPGKELLGSKIENPSYYASKRIPTIHYTMGGLCINTSAQVLTAGGQPIPGLYAAGEVTGGVMGSNRLGGNSYTDLIVFGRIAGASAAGASAANA